LAHGCFSAASVVLRVCSGTLQSGCSRRTWNSQHQPLTVTDAAGQTTTFTYNTAGQVLAVTNAKGDDDRRLQHAG
jgi:YD repeat-containing protein